MLRFERKDSTFHGSMGAAFEIKEISDTGIFEGYGATFGNVDQGGDIIMAGAFKESLIERPAQRIKLLWQHNPYQPIGKFLEAFEDERGLFVKGQLNMRVAQAAEAYALLQDGAIDGLSIGYRTMGDEIDRENGVRRIIKAALFECSLVTFPMNTAAGVSRVKGQMPSKRELEERLMRDAGLTAQQAKAFIAKGYDALSARDAGTGVTTELVSDLQAMTRAFRGH